MEISEEPRFATHGKPVTHEMYDKITSLREIGFAIVEALLKNIGKIRCTGRINKSVKRGGQQGRPRTQISPVRKLAVQLKL